MKNCCRKIRKFDNNNCKKNVACSCNKNALILSDGVIVDEKVVEVKCPYTSRRYVITSQIVPFFIIIKMEHYFQKQLILTVC